MEIRTNFMPGDSVWIMESNQPTIKTITCTRVFVYFDDINRFILSVHHSFDKDHKYFTPEQNVAATKDELKEKVFG